MHLAKARKIPVIHDCEALNEVNYGILYRKSKSWVAKHYPLHKKDADFVYPGGESFRQMQTRCVNFVQSLAQDRHSSTILIVAHAGVIRGLICHFLGLDYDSNLRQKISHRYIGDFDLAGSVCTRYDEIGERSGFVQTGTVSLPFPIATERVS
jgi:broad specificity phosphatase PhoE